MRNGSTEARWKPRSGAMRMPYSAPRRAMRSPIHCSTPGSPGTRPGSGFGADGETELLEPLVDGTMQQLHEARGLLHQMLLVEAGEGARLDRGFGLVRFVLGRGGNDQNRRMRPLRKLLQECHPVDAGQSQIERDDVGLPLYKIMFRFLDIRSEADALDILMAPEDR